MKQMARVGDMTIGHCSTHYPGGHEVEGTVIGGHNDILVAGAPQSRLGNIVVAKCGSTGTIDSGSSKVYIKGIPASRMGDSFSGTYSGTIISGAPKVLCA